MVSVKTLAESPELTSIPPSYVHAPDPGELIDPDALQDSIPTIDFSLLSSDSPHQRSSAVHELDRACRDWGFFTVINHGVPVRLMKEMMDACERFFNQTEEEKREFEGRHVLDPIRYCTSFNALVDTASFWRDNLKLFVHPQFHSPNKPRGFSEVAAEYSKRVREVAMTLLQGISESLGLKEGYMEEALNLESGLQILVANLYPPCPQPELGMGLGPHSDHGLLTLLIQNQIGGLQIQHGGKWIPVDTTPYSFVVNVADHIEILSNGEYKSVVHRVVVNNKATRMSIAMAHGPSLDAVVGPAIESKSPAFIPMRYGEYLELQQSNPLHVKSALEAVRIRTV